SFDVKLAAKANASRAGGGIFRVVDCVQLFEFSFRIVLDDDFQRTQHRHPSHRSSVEDLAHAKIKHCNIDKAIGLGDADPSNEIADGFRRHAAAAQPSQCRHSRIVPTLHMPATDKLGQDTLG